ncbi:hypothetical protein BH24DEI2_BH24DEI2_10230 [soil metagenome]
MHLTLVPLMGPFHLRYPLYNAVSVRDAVMMFEPHAVATTALAPNALADPLWRDTPELVLPHTVVPWARRRGVPIHGVYQPSPDDSAAQDFRRYAAQYPKLRDAVQRVDVVLRPLNALVEQPLALTRIRGEVLPLLLEHQMLQEETFQDGPGTDWLRARTEKMAEHILALPFERVAVLASVDHLPLLEAFLIDKADVTAPPTPEPTDETRERSLLDFAFRVEVPEPGPLLAKLRTLETLEARYHEANLLTANNHVLEALDVLERASRGDFAEPYYLPGYLLARLGQLYDLVENRAAALRSYRGVLALEYAPQEARHAARAGLDEPFQLAVAATPVG